MSPQARLLDIKLKDPALSKAYVWPRLAEITFLKSRDGLARFASNYPLLGGGTPENDCGSQMSIPTNVFETLVPAIETRNYYHHWKHYPERMPGVLLRIHRYFLSAMSAVSTEVENGEKYKAAMVKALLSE